MHMKICYSIQADVKILEQYKLRRNASQITNILTTNENSELNQTGTANRACHL
jgi:hypothetical protein